MNALIKGVVSLAGQSTWGAEHQPAGRAHHSSRNRQTFDKDGWSSWWTKIFAKLLRTVQISPEEAAKTMLFGVFEGADGGYVLDVQNVEQGAQALDIAAQEELWARSEKMVQRWL